MSKVDQMERGDASPRPPAYSLEEKGGIDVSHLEVKDAVKGADQVDLTGYVYVPDTPEERALVRKIDIHVLPMLWVMYIMNYVSGRRRAACASTAALHHTAFPRATVRSESLGAAPHAAHHSSAMR